MGRATNTKPKIAVYTAITGDFDGLKENQNTNNADFFAYLEQPHQSSTWNTRLIDFKGKTNNLTAKYYKLHPHKLFPDYEYSLWIDGSVELVADARDLVKLYLKNSSWAVHKHASRTCIIDEAFACVEMGKADPDVLSKQVARYIVGEKYPRNNGLAENTVILRRHNDPDVIKVNEDWWKECNEWSHRDQISFNYVAWKNNFEYKEMNGSIYTTPDFKLYPHK